MIYSNDKHYLLIDYFIKGDPMYKLLSKKYTITEEQCQPIISDYLSGMPVKSIYEKHNIHGPILYYILEVKDIPTRNKIALGKVKDHKKCKTCKATKPLNEFKKHTQNKDGYGCHCLDCYRIKDNSTSKRNRRKTRFGINHDQYTQMVKDQNNKCEICGNEEHVMCNGRNFESRLKDLSLDHDHTSGKVRGLLCHHCNVALGSFQDNPERLMSAIKYLEKYRE